MVTSDQKAGSTYNVDILNKETIHTLGRIVRNFVTLLRSTI
jgi:hypothetical protein